MADDSGVTDPTSDTARIATVGLFGKLPSHGDFLQRRVSEAFVAAWDPWLQACLSEVHESLGSDWLNVYLTSPVWRFACAAGACGPAPVIGLMVPSVDRVGRYFPLTIVAELSPAVPLLAAVRGSDAFLQSAETLVLDALEAEALDFDAFDAQVIELRHQAGAIERPRTCLAVKAAAAFLHDDSQGHWQVPVASLSRLTSGFEQLLSARLTHLYAPLVVLWSEGSAAVEPSCLFTKGLPNPARFVAMFNGGWSERGWRAVPVDYDEEAAPAESTTDDTVVPFPLRMQSAAATDVGRVRAANQDAYLERTEVGVWVVADGMGGHSQGDVASRMVCDAFAELELEVDFEQNLERARRAVGGVNAQLHRQAVRPENPVQSGSTVVAFFARGSRCAALWAGDSRVYRWRHDRLEQLTRDHSVAEEEGSENRREANVVTRAVGGDAELLLDVRYDRVQRLDRYLLCSDGLTKVVSEPVISECLRVPDIRAAVDGLIKAALAAGGPDNVTALVVEATL